MYELEQLQGLLASLCDAPDGHLDEKLVSSTRDFLATEEFAEDDMVTFIRDLRDKAVFMGRASGFIMTFFEIMLDGRTETSEAARARRDNLEKNWL